MINWIILKSKSRGTDYGVGTFITQLSNELANRENVKVYVLEIGDTPNKSFSLNQKNGITTIEIPVPYNAKEANTKSYQEKNSRNISRIISQYIPQEGYNIIHMNFVSQFFIATDLKKSLNGKIIFTQHLFINSEKLDNEHFDIEFETYAVVDLIITVTQHGIEHLTGKGVDAKKIQCIYNGIDPKHFNKKLQEDIKKKYQLTEDEKLVLYSGRLDPIKGLEYLCKAMDNLTKKIPNCRLVIAGDGDFKSLIKSARAFSANICYLGFIPFVDVVALYQQADIGVIPSLEEHCSYVALEMLNCGLPVVASNLGGLKEIFIHNKNALLANTVEDKGNMYGVAPEVKQLENHIFTLLTDESLRLRLGMNAKIRANSIFTSEIMADNYLQTINNLI